MDNTIKTILVPIDFSEQSIVALKQSYNLARLGNRSITLLHVLPESGFNLFGLFSKEHNEKLNKDIEDGIAEKMNILSKEASEKSGMPTNVLIDRGKVYQVILETAEKIKPKLIIMGTRNDIDGKRYIGSNTLGVIREAKCPVISINGRTHHEGCRNIILPLDLTKQTREKVSKSIEIAKYYNSTIKVIAVMLSDKKTQNNRLKVIINQVKNFIESKGITCKAEIINTSEGKRSLAKIIINYAKDNEGDLIMIMTQQEANWVEFFVGSTAQDIINYSDIPVMSIVPQFSSEIIIGGL
ncbi:MAG: universal stress protein [Bacteroidota bacterium]|nr:universal stress protein [Bacteroidota bacterium]